MEAVQAEPGCDQTPGSPQRSPAGAAEIPCPWVVPPPTHAEGEEPPPTANTDSKQSPHPNPSLLPAPLELPLKGTLFIVSRANQSGAGTLCTSLLS